jgi:hypothetical protein
LKINEANNKNNIKEEKWKRMIEGKSLGFKPDKDKSDELYLIFRDFENEHI